MNKSVSLLLLLFSILICVTNNGTVYANPNPNDTPPSLEEKFAEVGYKSVEEAVKEFENHFKRDVNLPQIKPSIDFSHQFGRFYEDKKYDINDFLSIHFVNEKSPENNYKVDIRPSKNKVVLKNKDTQQVYTLQNGQKAIYTNEQVMNFLVFEKDNWQYMLGIDKKVSNIVTPEVLVDIANSID